MATGKISKRTVDAAAADKRDTYLWDSELAGFGMKVTPTGKKVYLVQYRIGGRRGQTRRVTIGRHGSPWTPKTARKEAKRLLGDVASGRDPAEHCTLARRNLTLSELCDLYLAEGCITQKASTLATHRSNIDRHITPLLGRKRVQTIVREDVERFQQDVAQGKSATDIRTRRRGRAIVKGGKATAARSTAVLAAILSFAVRRNIRRDNPASGVQLFKGRKRERFLSPAEMARLGDVLAKAEREGENPIAMAAIRLLIMTGARKSEILTARWDWIDQERGVLRLPDSKTGAKVIPLGAAVLEILSKLPRFLDNPYVLPNSIGGHFVGLQKVWERLRKQAGLQDVRLHDLRHSFASVAVAGGDSLYLVGKVLGHKQSRTTEIYAHLADDPLRAVADRTSGRIAAAMNGANPNDPEAIEQNEGA